MRFSMLTETRVRALVDEVNSSDEVAVDAIVELFKGQAHKVLGFDTWTDFVKDREQGLHRRALTSEARAAAARALRVEMSIRSTAAVLGVDESTLRRSVGVERPPTAEVRTKRGRKIRNQVTQYREVMAAHPTWGTKAVSEHLGIRQAEALRRQRWSQAPGEIQGYLYTGAVAARVVDIVLAEEHAKDEDRVVVVRKYATGVITDTSPTRVRQIMALMPQIQPYSELVLRWRSPDLAMTPEQLSEALTDLRNNHRLSQQERRQREAETKMMVEVGFNAVDWARDVANQLALVKDAWPLIAANPYVKAKMVNLLRENGEEMLQLIDEGQPSADEEPQPLRLIQGDVGTL